MNDVEHVLFIEGVIYEVVVIGVDSDDFAGVVVGPLVVFIVKLLEVLSGDFVFAWEFSGVDLFDEGGDGSFEVDDEVWLSEEGVEGVEEFEVSVEVALGEGTDFEEVLCEDVSVFVDGTVLDDVLVGPDELLSSTESSVEEVDLHFESPAVHIVVEVGEVWVVVGVFEVWGPVEGLSEDLGKSGFT